MSSAIETTGLARTFGRLEAVRGLDLQVPAGSMFALIGPNGAGKTTTIKLLMNLVRPTRGSARILGVDSRRLGVAEFRRIGYVSENQQLPDWMTVDQLLEYCRPLDAVTIDDQWIADADLVIVRVTQSGSVVKTLEASGFTIQERPAKSQPETP